MHRTAKSVHHSKFEIMEDKLCSLTLCALVMGGEGGK